MMCTIVSVVVLVIIIKRIIERNFPNSRQTKRDVILESNVLFASVKLEIFERE